MKSADLVLLSDAIFDSVHDEPFPGGIAVIGERIEFVGPKTAVNRYIGPATVVRDFGDRLILPGFCDGHLHLEGASTVLFSDMLSGLETCRSEGEVCQRVRAFANARPGIRRVLGTNWLVTAWGDAPRLPTRHSLDAALPDIPVYLQSADAHSNWLNTAAIRECGLEKIVADLGEIEPELAPREADGSFTGVVGERVSGMVRRFAEQHSPEESAACRKKFLDYCASLGITAFTEASMGDPAGQLVSRSDLKALEASGRLHARVYMWTGFGCGMSDEDLQRVRDLQESCYGDRLRLVGLKAMLDGVSTTYTSYALQDYADKPGFRGSLVVDEAQYRDWVIRANRLGLPVKVHCTGNGACHAALDAFEASNAVNDNTGLPNAVEHVENLVEGDYARFRELGVIASMQPAHLVLDQGIGEIRYGAASHVEWSFRRLIDAGGKLAFGTDCPVVDLDPYHTLYKAVTRLDLDGANYSPYTMDQRLTLAETLKGYTAGSAEANGMLHKVGTLEPGKYADIAVADRNLFAVPESELKDCKTVCTVFSGEIVYEDVTAYPQTE